MLRSRSIPAELKADAADPSTRLPDGAQFALNAFDLKFNEPNFTAYRLTGKQPTEMDGLRETHGSEWFFYYRDSTVWALPLVEKPSEHLGTAEVLETTSHAGLDLLRARFSDVIPARLDAYTPLRTRPFVFLGQRPENNLAAAAFQAAQLVHDFVPSFEIRPKFKLDGRIVEIEDAKLQVALTVDISSKWAITAPLKTLAEKMDLAGMYVIRRMRQPKQRQLVGRITHLDRDDVILDESYDGLTRIPAAEVQLEGSKSAFRRCLLALFGFHGYKNFDFAREVEEAKWLSGKESFQRASKLIGSMAKKGPMPLAPGLTATLGSRLFYPREGERKSWVQFQPVEYCFDAARSRKKTLPWEGINEWGPFDQDSFEKRSPKILLVALDTVMSRVEQAIRDFNDGARTNSWTRGFASYFHLVNVKFTACAVASTGGTDPARRYCEAIEKHLQRDSDIDAALVIIRDADSDLPESRNPYLHAKALLLSTGIPVQEARESTILKVDKTGKPDAFIGYTYRNIAVALYAKLNGLPWTVSHTRTFHDELVLGIGLAEITGSRVEKKQRHMGITTAFRGDGNYLLSSITDECTYDQYPAVLRASMVNTLSELRVRNGWQKNDRIRIVFHGSKPLKNAEIDEIMAQCVNEAAPEQQVDFAFLDVSVDHPFTVFDTLAPGLEVKNKSTRKAVFVPERGLMVQLGSRTRLLSTIGPIQIKRDVTPIPRPLLIKLHDRSTARDLVYLSEQVLKFTSLTWRSTQPASKPVTIYYSELIAELLARLKNVPGWSPNMLRTRLLASKWFL
jgi:hypothetical protein